MPQTISASSPASLFMTRNKRWLPLYVQAVAVIGVLVIVESLFELRGVSYEWLIFAALAILTGSFSMRIGSVSAIVRRPCSSSSIRDSSSRISFKS